MKTLALPAPSLARHLARTIDGRSLTGIPGAWSTPIKRKPFRQRRVTLTPWQLARLHKFCTGRILCDNPPHPKTQLWTVVSTYECGALSISHVWAHNKAAAIEAHRELEPSIYGDEINLAAVPVGGKR